LTPKSLIDISVLLSTGRLIGTEDWVDLLLSQKEKLASRVSSNERRVLIVSGSNGLFGVSARTISQETGVEAINLSSHAGLGGDYILGRAKKFIREGDIILLPLEYGFYSSLGISDDFKKYDVLGRFLISYDRSSLHKISAVSLLNFALENAFPIRGKKARKTKKEYTSYFRGQLSKRDILERLKRQSVNGRCYSGLTFNEYGDETCNIGKEDAPVNPTVIGTAMPPSIEDIDPGGYIERFVKFSKERKAKIIPLYPVSTYTNDYQNLAFKKSAQKIKKFWEDQGIEFQDSLIDSLLAPDLMYDTNYHPRDTGRQQRTKSIISLIKKQLRVVEKEP